MKKLIVIFLLVMTSSAFATDRVGQDNITLLGDMLTRLWDELFPTTSTPYKNLDTTIATNLLNWAAENASTEIWCIQRDTAIIVVAGTERYALPSDFYEVPAGMAEFGVVAIPTGTVFETGMKLMNIGQKGQFRVIQSGSEIPSYYLIRKKELHIEPANNSGDTVRVYYAAYSNVLDTVGGADTTNINKEYIQYVILKAAEKYLKAVNWGNAQGYADSRLEIVQADLTKEERKLGITRRSVVEDMVR